jgi:Flp pilus assembly protein protease CpaA
MLTNLLLTLWLLPCALQDYRTRYVSNWLTLPAFVLAWPMAVYLGGSERLILTFAVFVGCWAAWQMHTMGAADGKIAVALAAVSPIGLGMGVAVLAGMFAGLWVWKRRSVSVPAAVGFYVGMVVATIVG